MLSDLRYAFRALTKSPGFAAIAIVTLALGIGANSAIFSVIDAVLLRPLPFPQPEQLIAVWSRERGSEEKETGSYPDYVDLRDQAENLKGLFAFTLAGSVLGTGDGTVELQGVAVTPEMFSVLGVAPMLGRTFTREDDTSYVMVLTYDAWRNYFNSDPKVIGREVLCSLRPYTIIGVMPPGYGYPVGRRCDYFMPLIPVVPDAVKNRGAQFLRFVGRLKPESNIRESRAEVATIAARLEQQYPDTNTGRTYYATSLHNDLVGNVRPALLMILVAVFFVLLIACANVANLMLARAVRRRREIAVRTALGAGRTQIIRQLLCEGFVLAAGGACGGLLLAWWGIDLLRLFGPHDVPRLAEIHINGGVIAFTMAAAVFSTFVFATFPALQVSKPNVNEFLQEGSRTGTGPESHRLRSLLVMTQVALSILLLAGAGLLIKSFNNLRATHPGFEASRVMTADLALPATKYGDANPDAPARRLDFFLRLQERLTALPGVEVAGGAMPVPFSGSDRSSSFWIAGRPDPGLGNHPAASHLTIVGNYFRVLKIPLLAGRAFTSRDNSTGKPVIMVNESFVRKFFPDRNALGEHILIDTAEKGKEVSREIVGIVRNTHHESLAIEPIPEFYVPFAQDPARRIDLVLRTSAPSLSGLTAAVRNAVNQIDRDVHVPRLQPLEEMIGTTLAQPRFNMMLLGTFAAVAMLLAAIGIYGVVAYSVAQRTREIGIRMALGAQRMHMFGMVLRQSLGMVVVGLAVGLIVSLGATRLMATLLYGVAATDFTIYAAVALLLALAALLASYLPARKAMKIDPVVALRYE